jgi:predicted phage tail protein
MFVVAISIVIYFAIRGSELSAWWIMLLGSMLGFSMLVAGVQQSLGWRAAEPEEEEEDDDDS